MLLYCITIWNIFRSFGIFFVFWYVWTKNNLATLVAPRRGDQIVQNYDNSAIFWAIFTEYDHIKPKFGHFATEKKFCY
jgi:hypothetical protein